MMKVVSLLGIVALLTGCNFIQKDEFVITGTISSYPKEVLICAYQTNGNFILDTIRVENGKLSYRKKLQEPIVASLVSRDPHNIIPSGMGVVPGPSVTLFMEPGTKLEINMDNARWPELQWKGGAWNNDLMKLYAKTLPLEHEMFELLRKSYAEGVTEEEKVALGEQRMTLAEKEKEEKIRFIKGNPSSYAAMYLLNGMRNDFTLKDYAATFAAFDQALREMPLGKEMQGAIDIALRTEVGAIAPDFEKVDKDGNTIRLSDYRGKYVLLDFWGSWCSPCRDSHPHLKEIEAKYRDKGLVVINIATENGSKAREIWLQAIEEDGMTWTQILNNEGKDKCDVVKDYAITAFPTKVLIDGDGKIVVRAVGESEPIDAKLKEVFGE